MFMLGLCVGAIVVSVIIGLSGLFCMMVCDMARSYRTRKPARVVVKPDWKVL